MFEAPKENQFTQGTIFSCGHADNYSQLPVYGLVITARCDAAQKKVPIYSFIPVVSIQDWTMADGVEIVLTRQKEDCVNTQKNILEALDISPSVLRTSTAMDVAEKILQPLSMGDRKVVGRVQKFLDSQATIQDIETALKLNDRALLLSLLKKASKSLDQVLKELAGNRLTGYYLLREMPSILTDGGDYVALLREVHHIPNSVATWISKGISQMEWEVSPVVGSCCPIFGSNDDYCMPVAKLKSPWMEHLMQSWTLLFSRIGVEDVDFASVKRSLDSLGLEAV